MNTAEVLCLYGYTDTQAKKKFADWLQADPHRQIYVVQHDVRFYDLGTRDPSSQWQQLPDQNEEAVRRFAWETLNREVQCLLAENLPSNRQELGKAFFERIRLFQAGAHSLLSDVSDCGCRVVSNILTNLFYLQEALPAPALAGSMKGVPAVICGAGPSLEENLPLLGALAKNALILAGGSALNALSCAGVIPHFAAAIDPHPPEHLFQQQTIQEVPFLYQNRVSHGLLTSSQGPKIWLPDGLSYPIEQWFLRQMKIEANPLSTGWNVATCCLGFAALLGCSPIVLVGVDLAILGDKEYAPGVDMPKDRHRVISARAVETKKDFLLAADWLADFSAQHPDLRFINTSSKGLRIEGIEVLPLHVIADSWDQRAVDLQGKIHAAIHKVQPLLSCADPVHTALAEWKKTLFLARQCVDNMLDLMRRDYPEDPKMRGEYILSEVELEEQPVYQELCVPVWEIWRWILLQKQADEPYPGFDERMQRLLFFQTQLRGL